MTKVMDLTPRGHITGSLEALEPGRSIDIMVRNSAPLYIAAKAQDMRIRLRKISGTNGVKATFRVTRLKEKV